MRVTISALDALVRIEAPEPVAELFRELFTDLASDRDEDDDVIPGVIFLASSWSW